MFILIYFHFRCFPYAELDWNLHGSCVINTNSVINKCDFIRMRYNLMNVETKLIYHNYLK